MSVRKTPLPSGEGVPVLGQGTWHFGEDPRLRRDEIAALRTGLDLGMRLIDTAEMYAAGAAEEIIGEALAGRRNEAFIVGKVLPGNASHKGTVAACEASLKRLGTDRLDLYLLHWRGNLPLEETIDAFESLVKSGKIRHWGVSNFEVSDMEETFRLGHGSGLATNQVVYNLKRRGIEWDLLPWCDERKIPVMAYSPLDQGELRKGGVLKQVAKRHSAAPAQIALAWVLRRKHIIAIPKSGKPSHVRENFAALDLNLTDQDLQDLDRAFPPPSSRKPLEII